MDDNREQELNFRLTKLHERFDWIANEKERSAWVSGYAASPSLYEERIRLIERAEDILLQLMKQPNAPRH
jgi:hypothetical protein